MKTIMMTLAMVGLLVGPAAAYQCPLLIKQIMDATAGKTDAASQKAVGLANEAKVLHEAGKHEESIKKAQEAAAAINLNLKMKK
jgi:long-subunit fatty acid transport protein